MLVKIGVGYVEEKSENNRKENLRTDEIGNLIQRWNSKPLGDEIEFRYFYSIPRTS